MSAQLFSGRGRLLFGGCAIGLTTLLPAKAQVGHQHGAGHGGMAAKAGLAELGATAAFDHRATLWAAHKADGHVVVSRSGDLGRTWSAPMRVNPQPEATDTGGDARPKIACGPGGEIYVSWTRPMTKPYTGEIRFTRSVDGGATFALPLIVHADRQEITHRFDALAVDARGRVVVAWVDKRDLAAARPAGPVAYRGAAIYFAVSDDRGATFQGDRKLADHSCECCRIALVAREDGGMTAMWRHIFAPNIRDHAIADIAVDGRGGELQRATFDNWALEGCPHQGPAFALDGAGRRHAVWFSGAPKNSGVFYGRLEKGGVAGLRRVGGERAERADIAVHGRRVAVVWKEFDGVRSQLRGMMSADGGERWREFALGASDEASDHPRLLRWQERFFVFWNTRSVPLSVTELP